MRHSIATVSLSGTLREKIRAVAASGYDGVELCEHDLLTFDGTPSEVRKIVEDSGLELIAYQPFRDFEGLPEELRCQALERAARKLELTQQLGAQRLLVVSNTNIASIGEFSQIVDDFQVLGDLADEEGVEIGFEALAWGTHIWDYRDAWEIVRRVDHPRVKVVLDNWHIMARQLPLDTILKIPPEKISFVQTADAPDLVMGLLDWSRHHRCFPGQGCWDVREFMNVLASTGYNGWISQEVFNDRFRMADPLVIAQDGKRSFLWLQGKGDTGETLPESPRISAVSSLELSINETVLPDMTALLAGMGFSSQDLNRTHWCQGNFEINLSPSSGTNVPQCSIVSLGLNSENPRAHGERAVGLLAPVRTDQVTPTGRACVCLEGPNGATISLEVSEQAAAHIASDDMLRSIDHVALNVGYPFVHTWDLFLRSVLNFEDSPHADIVDPSGLVESMAFHTPDNSARICLNTSLCQKTLQNRLNGDGRKMSIQHVAFATDEIFKTVGTLEKNGISFAKIPCNYYDDIQAKFGLSEQFISRLKSLNLLYDREDGGTFIHAYTKVMHGTIFFEIVERNLYEGYGVVNAAIRTAALRETLPSDEKRYRRSRHRAEHIAVAS